jgi:hypothetical protein
MNIINSRLLIQFGMICKMSFGSTDGTWLTTVVAPGTPMAALTALTGLTELAVGGNLIDDAVAVNVLGHMTHVKDELETRSARRCRWLAGGR